MAKKTTKKKTSTKKKGVAKKKATTKKTSVARKKTKVTKKTAPKKTAAKKKTAKKKTKVTKKTAPKKTAAKKKTKVTKKTAEKVATTKKKSKKKKKAPTTGRRRSRSVADVAKNSTANKDGYVFVNGRRVRMIAVVEPSKLKSKSAARIREKVKAVVTRRQIKTRMTPKTLGEFRELLLTKRQEVFGSLGGMEKEALRSDNSTTSRMSIHMADIGSDAYDQDLKLGMAASERERIRDIDEALARIENRTYGVCQLTHKAIPRSRLKAKPWAKYTIDAARTLERRRGL